MTLPFTRYGQFFNKQQKSMDPSCQVMMVEGIFSWYTLGSVVLTDCLLNIIIGDLVYPFLTTTCPCFDGYCHQDNMPCHKA